MTFQAHFRINPLERYVRTPWRVLRKTPMRELLAPTFPHACNVCGQRGFFLNKTFAHLNCPLCKSSNRHRLLVWYLEHDQPQLLRPGTGILHVAPEPCLQAALAHMPELVYTTCDLARAGVDHHIDLQTDIVAPERFDLILINHVLEHVPDDAAAMRNLFAMVKPGGLCIVTVPLRPDDLPTDEDLSITDPAIRGARFGQPDHLRYYGKDIAGRLEAAGFAVTLYDAPENADPRYSMQGETLFLARRAL